jgi:hypothetical protein
MIRVCRPNGLVFLSLPEYRFPSEPHYKIWMIPFAPRWLQAVYLEALGRHNAYLWSLSLWYLVGLAGGAIKAKPGEYRAAPRNLDISA